MSVKRKLGSLMLKRGFAEIKDEQGRVNIAGAKKLVKAHLLPINHPYVGI